MAPVARDTPPIISVRGLTRSFSGGGHPVTVLHRVDLDVRARESVAVVGPSGSGKTTLLGLLAGLDRPTAGRVMIDGRDIGTLSEDERAELRVNRIGFVFQTFRLLPTLTALENVLVPMELARRGRVGRRDAREDRDRANDLLVQVGLGDRARHHPAQLSGGERQRVALARAFANRPDILLADEPTGNLDAATGLIVAAILDDLNRAAGTTLVLVTHDRSLAGRADRIVRMEGGRIVDGQGRCAPGPTTDDSA